MSRIKFSIANITDADEIMQFMHKHWRKNHILATSKLLLLYEFKENNSLNIGVAKDKNNRIIAIFGFIKYNSSKVPDLAGSLWKVTDDAQKNYPMVGIQLRNFVIKNIPHIFFAAPGAGLQTKPIYQLLRMNWNIMEHWFWINPEIASYQIASFKCLDKKKASAEKTNNNIFFKRALSIEDLLSFDDESLKNFVPFKDLAYIKNRYFNYPFYKYDIWYLQENNKVLAIIVCRRTKINKSSVYRIVDFIGKDRYLVALIGQLKLEVIANNDEYLDFICFGIDDKVLQQSGMEKLDMHSDDIVIPNFFEPLVKKNTPVYCVSDKTNLIFRQFKADGDQDRPNYTG